MAARNRKTNKISSLIAWYKRTNKPVLYLSILLIISLLGNLVLLYQAARRDRVAVVVDGDSFTTFDGRRIRLLGIDAPERNRCLYQEAKNLLSKLVLGKRVRLTDVIKDDYGRLLANVRAGKVLVNEVMVREGLARFSSVKSPVEKVLIAASQKAKTSQSGIYSPLCKTAIPPAECEIKGNLRAGEKTYYLPYCDFYDQVIVDEAYGDRWFCSEEQAQEAGYQKAFTCKGN